MSDLAIIESVIARGDLSQLKPEERVLYYKATCDSLGLNPLTKPFEYITLNGKLTLYARKDATDQIRARRNVSIVKLEREIVNDVYVVTAYAEVAGRGDSSIGAVNITALKGDALANAMMKAETKAKRRVTLSICGLGMLDETEVETIPNAIVHPSPQSEPPINVPVVVVSPQAPAPEDTESEINESDLNFVESDPYISVRGSKGELYSELSLEDLTFRFNATGKAIDKFRDRDDLTEAELAKLNDALVKHDAAEYFIQLKKDNPHF